VFDHHRKAAPAKAEERTESAVRRALAEGWNFKRIEEYAQRLSDGKSVGDGEPVTPTASLLFVKSSKKFAIDLMRLKSATQEQRDALRAG
jgi:hypothetical protein